MSVSSSLSWASAKNISELSARRCGFGEQVLSEFERVFEPLSTHEFGTRCADEHFAADAGQHAIDSDVSALHVWFGAFAFRIHLVALRGHVRESDRHREGPARERNRVARRELARSTRGAIFLRDDRVKQHGRQGGTLCVRSPVVRLPAATSSAQGAAPCDGGTHVRAQLWSRDDARLRGFEVSLTDALEFAIDL